MRPIIILGTGRCGSTMLSKLLNFHPEVLSLSEFFCFVSDIGGNFDNTLLDRQISASEFWQLIAGIPPRMDTMMKHQITMQEVIYPYQQNTHLFSAKTGVPAILQATLPHISHNFDALYLELEKEVNSLPTQSLRQMYDKLFQWLCTRLNKKLWVERSGGSLVSCEYTLNLYPDSKYVHIMRDGRNTSISMAKHPGFRMFLLSETMKQYLGVDPFYSTDRSNLHQLPDSLHQFLPENFNREAFLNFQHPYEVFGEIWSDLLTSSCTLLANLPQENILNLDYDDFVKRPNNNLARLAEFIGFNAENHWIRDCLAMIKPSNTSWKDLPKEDQLALNSVCRRGLQQMENIFGNRY